MSLKNYKQVITGLLFLNACLAGVQIWAICTGNFSILFPLLMFMLPLLVIRGCHQVSELPTLTAIKTLKWELRALKNLKFELFFLIGMTLIPLGGGPMLTFLPSLLSINVLWVGMIFWLTLQTVIVFVSCCQFVLTCDLLERTAVLFETLEAPQET